MNLLSYNLTRKKKELNAERLHENGRREDEERRSQCMKGYPRSARRHK